MSAKGVTIRKGNGNVQILNVSRLRPYHRLIAFVSVFAKAYSFTVLSLYTSHSKIIPTVNMKVCGKTGDHECAASAQLTDHQYASYSPLWVNDLGLLQNELVSGKSITFHVV